MTELTPEQEMLTNHRWFHQLTEWLEDNHKAMYNELKEQAKLELWAVKKLESALEMKERMEADGLHPSQANELARDDMFSL